MSIKVGIDYDEPIFPWYRLAHQASLEAGIALPEHEPTSWAPHETYGCTLDEWVKVLDDEVLKGRGGMYAAPLDDTVKWQLHRLAQAGAEIHIVTARGSLGSLGETIKQLTFEQVEREGLPYTGLHFAPDKGPIVTDLGLDYFIDDRPKHWEEVAATGCDVYLLDATWNHDFEVPKGKRVSSLEEFVDAVLEDSRLRVVQ